MNKCTSTKNKINMSMSNTEGNRKQNIFVLPDQDIIRKCIISE